MAWITSSRASWTLDNLVIGRNVVVIGAGNTAIDCATIAKRLGANQVTMVYRRSEKEMTAYAHEYDFIKREGVRFSFLTQPVRVHVENGAVNALECLRMSLGPADASGRPSPQPVAGSEFVSAGGPDREGHRARETFSCFRVETQNRKRIHSGGREFRNELAGRVCRRRLYSGARCGFHSDGGARRKIGRAFDSREVGGTWLI